VVILVKEDNLVDNYSAEDNVSYTDTIKLRLSNPC